MEYKHWGEIISKTPTPKLDISHLIGESTKKDCLDKFAGEEPPVKDKYLELDLGDPLVLHAIALHQYGKRPDSQSSPVPELPKREITHKVNKLNYLSPLKPQPKPCTEVPETSEPVVQQALNTTVAILLAQIGFEKTNQSIMDVLVDVLNEFLQKISHKIRIASEDEESHKASGFPHIIERVLTDMGMNGIIGLRDYYENRVVQYIKVLEKRYNISNETLDSIPVKKQKLLIKEEAI